MHKAPSAPVRREREISSRETALKEFPLGTAVGREFIDTSGEPNIFRGKVVDFYDPYWRIEYPDDDWEELTRRELTRGIRVVTQPPTHFA